MAQRELHPFSVGPTAGDVVSAAATLRATSNRGTLDYIHIQSLDARRHIPALIPPRLPTRLDP